MFFLHICKLFITFAPDLRKIIMKKRLFFALVASVSFVCGVFGATVYTRVGSKPATGWPGTYIIVYQVSDTKAYVWNGVDESRNYQEVSINNGKITSDELESCQVTVTQEGTNEYGVKAANGYIYTNAKENGIEFAKGAHACTIKDNGGYVQLETNTNTCRFVYHAGNHRFRFYYDKDKKWDNTDYKNIHFYVLGDVEIDDGDRVLDINYAQAEMYACASKFPTQSNPYDQYFSTFLWLLQREDENAVPQVGLEILAPTQYSLVGADVNSATYKSSFAPEKKLYINITAGSKHSFFIFPSKAESGYSEAALTVAEMTITKVGKSSKPNAYVYHIKLEFTDSNRKIWKLDKDLDVYAWWIDCNRSGKELEDMEPVAFPLESEKHETEDKPQEVELVSDNVNQVAQKMLVNGQLVIMREGKQYNVMGVSVE